MPAIVQTVAGAAQFDGLTSSTGLFSFNQFDDLPQTTRVNVVRCAYHGTTGGNAGSRVDFYFQDPDLPLNRVLLGRGLAPGITGPAGDADFGVCGGIVPRTRGGIHWALHCTSASKDVTASVTVDYMPQPYPHASAQDAIP